MFKIEMAFGLDKTYEETKEFKTLAEAQAYLEGIGDMDGWLNVYTGDIEEVKP